MSSAVVFAALDPMSLSLNLVKKLECGDSGTSASTIRTAGAVVLVVIVGGAVITAVSGVTWHTSLCIGVADVLYCGYLYGLLYA